MKFGAIYCLYDDHEYLEESLFPHACNLSKVLFLISDVPWNGEKADNSKTVSRVKKLCEKNPNFELIEDHWENEIDQRNFGLAFFYKKGIDYAFIIDSDEIYRDHHFKNIKKFILKNPEYDAFHIKWNTYWTKNYYRIQPRENYNPVIAVRVSHFLFTIIRGGITSVIRSENSVIKTTGQYNGVLIPPEIAICFHLSYARNNEYMKRKLETNSHAGEFLDGWYENVWLKWTPNMRHLHPVAPTDYGMAVREDFPVFPDQLKVLIKKEKLKKRMCSIIILNWNSCGLLERCLELVKLNTCGIPYEIIVVDNGSANNSIEYIKSLDCKKIFNKENKGFPAGVNQAIRMTKDTDVCLLNVDAEVQEGWLEKMYETMIKHPCAGMVGPLGNRIKSGHQREGYVSNDTITPNLYGYCMLIMRELIDKIGLFDEIYGPIGGYEDNDYGIRAKLAGYELYISAKSLVKHEAHQVYKINGLDNYENDRINREKYLNKFYGVLLNYGKIMDLYSNQKMSSATRLVIV